MISLILYVILALHQVKGCDYVQPYQYSKKYKWLLPPLLQEAPMHKLVQLAKVLSNDSIQIEQSDEVYFPMRQIGKGGSGVIFYAQDQKQNLVTLKILNNETKNSSLLKSTFIQNYLIQKNIPYIHKLLRVYKTIQDNYTLVHQTIPDASNLRDFANMQLHQIAMIFYKVLRCLQKSHAAGIMHRDIKARNILYNPSTKNVRVIDWNLADLYKVGKVYAVKIGTIVYNSPQLLMNYSLYDYSADIWALGIIFLQKGLQMDPNIHLLRGGTKKQLLKSVALFYGSKELYQYIKKYEFKRTNYINEIIKKFYTKKKIVQLVNRKNFITMHPLLIDLAEKMLKLDHRQRITASEALKHPFFQYTLSTQYLKINQINQ